MWGVCARARVCYVCTCVYEYVQKVRVWNNDGLREVHAFHHLLYVSLLFMFLQCKCIPVIFLLPKEKQTGHRATCLCSVLFHSVEKH